MPTSGSPAAIGRGGLLLFVAEGEEEGGGFGNRNLTTPHTRVGKKALPNIKFTELVI